ncbi:MAG: class I SAM-dependent methyltransferase [Allosphingosinicella sp.]|uniref:class I SAM-dependent methyltransferase n=1 Tax=Allosphingosinicella sp. TaxID=2823234 RepID=UPI00394E5DB7
MKKSALFAYIEELQGGAPWGHVLDAGTGTHSMGWILSLATERWTAVSGSSAHAAQVRALAGARMRDGDRLLVGNWADPALLAGEAYDTVLADYLLGAVEGFAPYFQTELFARLRPLTRGRLYVTGLEPYVVAPPEDEAGQIVWEIGRFRDACLTLAGELHYREYPLDWVLARLERSGFRVVAARKFNIRYKAAFVNSQIDMCGPRLDRRANRGLAGALRSHGEELRGRALAFVEAHGGLRHGFDYVIAADPM